MKITIDTKQDSHEEIKTVMRILNHALGSKNTISGYSNPEPKSEPANTGNLMSMFANTEPVEKKVEASTAIPREIPDTAPDFSSFLNLTKTAQEKRDDDEPKIELF